MSGGETSGETSAGVPERGLRPLSLYVGFCLSVVWGVFRQLRALDEVVEEAGGPVLCFYAYKHDLDRIQARYGGKMEVRKYEGAGDLADWNAGKIDLLLAHPASTAYGLNMQRGGHTAVWFSTGWNLELYDQANARLHRQGQEKPVTVVNLVARGTVDERMAARGTDIAGRGGAPPHPGAVGAEPRRQAAPGLLSGQPREPLPRVPRAHPHGDGET